MRGWTRRLGRSKSSSSDKSRKQNDQPPRTSRGGGGVDSQIRPEALDASNTGVASRRESSQQQQGQSGQPPRVQVSGDATSPELDNVGHPASPSSDGQPSRFLSERLAQMDGFKVPTRQNSSRLEVSEERQLERLPSFEDVPVGQQRELFFRKIDQCKVMFDFEDPVSDSMGKEIKRTALSDLINFVSSAHDFTFDEQVYREVFAMFRKNIFRSIPPPKNPYGEIFDPDDDEPVNVDAWPHMHLVYEFLLRFMDAPDFKVVTAEPYIGHTFILTLLSLFDSEDPRERDSLKTTLHRIYGKFLKLRAFIRRSINNIFLQFVYETGRFNGIAELLEIFGSIINGFAIPLKEEHKIFLNRVLIPLHRPRGLSLYHSQLSYCVVQFIEKDPTLTEEVVHGLLKYWPKTSSPKEILFLLELEDILETIEPNEFVKVEEPLFKQLARCIGSPHCQVAERALFNWNHDYFCHLVAENSEVILPIIFGSLRENARHWNRTIHSMIFTASKMLLETNPVLYHKCDDQYRMDKEQELHSLQSRSQKWSEIERLAGNSSTADKAEPEGSDTKPAAAQPQQKIMAVSSNSTNATVAKAPANTRAYGYDRAEAKSVTSINTPPLNKTKGEDNDLQFVDCPSPSEPFSPQLLSCPPSPGDS